MPNRCLFILLCIGQAAGDASTCAAGDAGCVIANSLIQGRTFATKEALSVSDELKKMSSEFTGFTDFRNMQLDPVQVETRIANLVTGHVEKGEQISEIDMTLIEQVIDLLTKQVQPSIKETRNTEQRNVNLHLDAVEQCNKDFEKAGKAVEHAKNLKKAQEDEWKARKAVLDKEEGEKTQTCGAFNDWVVDLGETPGPEGNVPCPFPPTTDYKHWLQSNRFWFDDKAPEYVSKSDSCDKETSDHDAEKITFAAETHIYNTYVCDHCDDTKLANEQCQSCRSEAMAVYFESTQNITKAVASRKIEWEAIERAVQYLSVLQITNSEEQAAKLQWVKTEMVVDTSFLEVDFGTPAAEVQYLIACTSEVTAAAQCESIAHSGTRGGFINKTTQWWMTEGATMKDAPQAPFTKYGGNEYCSGHKGEPNVGSFSECQAACFARRNNVGSFACDYFTVRTTPSFICYSKAGTCNLLPAPVNPHNPWTMETYAKA